MFVFSCRQCGEQEVTEDYFDKFLNDKLRGFIQTTSLDKPMIEIKWEICFKNDCPLCRPNGRHKGKVKMNILLKSIH